MSWQRGSGAGVATQRPCDEDAALELVASMITAVRETGMTSFHKANLNEKMSWSAALGLLSSPPTNRMLAEALTHEVFDAFLPTLHHFESALRAGDGEVGPEVLLRRLHEAYGATLGVLEQWCRLLGVPEMVQELHVRLRCALLQPDLLTHAPPPARDAFLDFLRHHAESWLSRQAECGHTGDDAPPTTTGDEGGCDDAVMQCLHDLTLSRTREVRQLWQRVLESCIEAKVAALAQEEDYTVHALPACLAWQESVVNSFVHRALPVTSPASMFLCPSNTIPSGGWWHTAPRALAAAVDLDDSLVETRAVRAEWCGRLRQRLLTSFARARLAVFWDVLVEYPDSTPALEDVQYCLQACPEGGLREELIHTVRHLLASRLHRAGTRTEDILSVLSKTIHSLCVLLPRSEQSSVTFAVVADTLDHLRRRKDCVSTIVKAITQPKSDVCLFSGNGAFAATEDDGTEDEEGSEAEDGAWRDAQHTTGVRRWRGGARPDVLRVLLTAIRVRVLAQEYRQVLAERLLTKPPHSFDVSAEEEVLERLKCVFGERALMDCVIMLHDVEKSRRMTAQLREVLRHTPHDTHSYHNVDDEDEDEDTTGRASVCLGRGFFASHVTPQRATVVQLPPPPSTPLAPDAISVDVLSLTAWPPLESCAGGGVGTPSEYTVHPLLRCEMDRIGRAYGGLKVNRKLVWLCAHGQVELELMQCVSDASPEEGMQELDSDAAVPVTHLLSLFDASLVLFVQELDARRVPATVATVAREMGVAEGVVRAHVAALTPAVLTCDTAGVVAVQTRAVSSTAQFVFDDATATVSSGAEGDASSAPAGVSAEQLKMLQLMITAMLKAGGPKSVAEIHNSMKIFGQFTGTVTEMKKLLQQLVLGGTLVMDSAKQLYSLPR